MYKLISLLFRTVLWPFVGKFHGLENIPSKGGAVVVANHGSYLDHYLIGVYFKAYRDRDVWFLAKKEHFNNPFAKIYHSILKAVPLDRKTGGREAIKKAEELLKKGELVVIYPEGTRTLTGDMMRGKPGAAKLALSAGVPMIPVGIHHAFEIWPKWQKLPKPGKKAEVYIGEPISFEEYYGRQNEKSVLQKVTTIAMYKIAALAGKPYPFDHELLEQEDK